MDTGASGQGTTAPTDTGSAAPEPSTKPTTTATTKPTGTGTGTGKTDPAACDACISAASGGNIGGAAAAYNRCPDAAKKSQCSGAAKTRAPAAAKTAARNGNCAQAKGIIAAAKAMGAGSPGLDGALAGTSCK